MRAAFRLAALLILLCVAAGAGAQIPISVSPDSAPAGSPVTIYVSGSSAFSGLDQVTVNGSPVSTMWLSPSTMMATVDLTGANPGDVYIIGISDPTFGTATFTVLSGSPAPMPVLQSISPTGIYAGSSNFTLTLSVANLTSSSVVTFNGNTILMGAGSGSIGVGIPSSDVTSAGPVGVVLSDPAIGSESITFQIVQPTPSISSVSPTYVNVGGATFNLTVSGSGFVGPGEIPGYATGSTVLVNGTPVPTTYQPNNSPTLVAQVPAVDIAAQGAVSITVVGPNGNISNAASLSVITPTITLTGIGPTSAIEGGAGFTLTASGTNFVSGAKVYWNGAALPTTFVSTSQLTAQVPASDLASTGTASVTAADPTSGMSNALGFAVNPDTLAVSPSYAFVGSPDLTITVTGVEFTNDTQVTWNGAALATTFVSSSTLTATVPAADLDVVEVATVSVSTPTGDVKAVRLRKAVRGRADTAAAPNPAYFYVRAPSGGPYNDIARLSAGSVGTWHAILNDSSLIGWGDDYDGDVGDGNSRDNTATVTNVTNLIGVVAVNDGEPVEALLSNGTVWVWGNNVEGGLGLGSSDDNPHPTPIQLEDPTDPTGYLTGVTALSGSGSLFALKSDGTVRSWGFNNDGELGLGFASTDPTWHPTKIPGLTGVTQIADGVALTSDGSVYTWGSNTEGWLGNGTTDSSSHPTPAKVSGLPSSIVAIAIGMALASDGTVWTWGYNQHGECGLGYTTPSSPYAVPTPAQVPGLSGVVAIARIGGNCLTLRSDGTVWSWGNNFDGMVGMGSYTPSSIATPTEVVGPGGIGFLSAVTAISLSNGSALALLEDGTLWSWGDGLDGQLGNGVFGSSASPVQVGSAPAVSMLTPAAAATGGAGFSMTVTGLNFGAGAKVQWNGQARSTSYVSANQLTVQVQDTDIVNPGAASVTVANPDGTLSAPASFAVNGAANAVSGTIGLEEAANLEQTLQFTFHEIGVTTFTRSVTLAADGSYSVSGLPTGTYNIGVKGPKWLRKTLTGVSVSGQVAGISPSLLAGDINGDNVVDLNDFSLLAEAFGSDSSSANWNVYADLNCDGVVDLNDFSLLAANFGVAGDPAP
jgi:alpha-tubulin suppressor-like RCC1 family protein